MLMDQLKFPRIKCIRKIETASSLTMQRRATSWKGYKL